MCKSNSRKAFFSLDASIAFISTLFTFAAFLQLIYYASESFSSYSKSVSYTLLSLRISSAILDQLYEGNASINLEPLRESFKLSSVKASLVFEDEASIDWNLGAESTQVYCTKRLAFLSGKIALLRVCIS
ncbi:MAG: hypothetical protein QXT25_00760 [Candidatus Anstonellaceae archaeon]